MADAVVMRKGLVSRALLVPVALFVMKFSGAL
jgi:hypothetical protein